MKIVISNYDDLQNPYYAGGGAIAVHEVAKRLAGKGHTVSVVTANFKGAKNETKDGVLYKRIGWKWGGRFLTQIFFQLALVSTARKMQFDVWLESFTAPFSTTFIPWFTKKPVVGLLHFPGAKTMEQKYHLPFTWVENYGLKQYTHCIALTDINKKQLLTSNPNLKVAVIPNGLPETYITFKPKEQKLPYLLFIGRIDIEQKGLDLLLTTYTILLKQTNLKLKIAGSGATSQLLKLRQLINQNKLTDSVELLGRVTGQAKQNLIAEASAVVMTSKFENQSLVALEALALGAPLVCFDIPGFDWIPAEFAIKIKPFEVNAMAQSIYSLLQNSETTEKLIGKAKLFSNQFSWDHTTTKYEYFILSATV